MYVCLGSANCQYVSTSCLTIIIGVKKVGQGIYHMVNKSFIEKKRLDDVWRWQNNTKTLININTKFIVNDAVLLRFRD